MAFIGTPLDTRNTFQSLVGKRFNGDGSTTAFTLDVAPSSVLDIEVFVGNVRQDPNSAYTLSGTTLTFTGAPPSGTNNIYVVHQAKSVGTIGIPDDTISARTLVTLDNSADHVLIEDATDGELKKALIPAASFAGIDDQTSSNDDQLTITDTAVVINEDSDDVDFRVESNGNANMLFVSGGNDVVGVGAEGDLGVGLHIKAADSGASVTSDANELVVEDSGSVGMTLIGGTSSDTRIAFGDSGASDQGKILYANNGDFMRFDTSGSERMRINTGGRVGIGTTSNTHGLHLVHNNSGNYVAHLDNSNDSTPYGLKVFFSGADPDDTTRQAFIFVGDQTQRCIIMSDGDLQNHDNSYGSISDQRIKQNITDANSQWDDIKNIKVRNFKKKDDVRKYGDNAWEQIGLVAQELETVSPKLLKEIDPCPADILSDSSFGTLYEDGDDIPEGKKIGDVKEVKAKVKAIKYSILYMKAIKALQESMTRIETLEAKVKALEEA